jgi:DNA-binding NarL/FixJ family response regulator
MCLLSHTDPGLDPDALVIDISMPILNGLQAAKQLQTANCRTKIIFLGIYDGPDFPDAAFSAGAAGYITKPRLSTDLTPAFTTRCWDKSLYPGLPMQRDTPALS